MVLVWIFISPCRQCGDKLANCDVKVLYLGEHFCVFCSDLCLKAWKQRANLLGLSDLSDLHREMSKNAVRFIIDRM